MVKLDTYQDITGSPELVQEFDYVSVDSLSWLRATAVDVTEYWQEIVNRCARDDESDARDFYTGLSVSAWNLREARNRVVKALVKRGENVRYADSEGVISGWTGNQDSNFYQDFGYASAPLTRGGWGIGYLLFVSAYNTNGHDTGLDYVFQVDSWDALYEVLSPRIEFSCDECGVFGDTLNGGYSFETYSRDGEYGDTASDLLADGQASCPNGHSVTLWARDSF